MTIVFMGTPAFAVPTLRRLASDRHEIAAVYTQPDRPAGRGRRLTHPPVKQAALDLGLSVRQPESLRDPQAQAELAALAPQAIVVVGYGQLLPQAVLDIPPRGVLNAHPSLLPRHRGASPIPAAILAGDRETGVTVMLMDAGMDTGPALAQQALPIEASDTAGTLSDRLSELAADLVAATLPDWLAGRIEPKPQEESRATKAPLLRKEHGAIDWSLPVEELWRRVRAYNPWPGAFTTLDGELLYIWEAWPLDYEAELPTGTVVQLSETHLGQLPAGSEGAFGVQTGRGVLAVLSVQRAGRRALPAGEFARGARGLFGRKLVTP